MEIWILYSLKVSLGLMLFYLFFRILMSGDTFFRFNRLVLLVGMLICGVLPFVPIETQGRVGMVQDAFCQLETFLQTREESLVEIPILEELEKNVITAAQKVALGSQKEKITVGKNLSATIWRWSAEFIYVVGGLVTLVWLLIGYVSMLNVIRKSRRIKYPTYTLVLSARSVCPFCWGKYIVMSENDYNSSLTEILTHEKMHMQGGHTFDLLFMDFCILLFWFNPAVWLLKKKLQEIHEFEADHGVINQGIDATKYQLLLVKKAAGARLYSIANGLNHSKLKNRITMMLKKKSNRWARLKILFFIPLAAFLALSFARPDISLAVAKNVQDSKITQISNNLEVSDGKTEKVHFVLGQEKTVQKQENHLVVSEKKLEKVKQGYVALISLKTEDSKYNYGVAEAELRSFLDTANFGNWQNVRIVLVTGKKDLKNEISKIVAEKNVDNVSVSVAPPPPPPPPAPKYIVDVVICGYNADGSVLTDLMSNICAENVGKVKFDQFKGLRDITLKTRTKELEELVLKAMKEQGITDVKVVSE